MNKKILLISICVFALGIVLSSCDETGKTFSKEENMIIDSLYRVKLDKSKPKLDSICDSIYQARFPVMVDSIKEVRKREILDLINE